MNRIAFNKLVANRFLLFLALPGFLFIIIFKFVPMWGFLLAFQDYSPFKGFMGSKWVGFTHFMDMFHDPNFLIMLRNTLVINLLSLVFYFPLPIIMALMLNEAKHELFKKLNQSIVYLPHFLSWVIVSSMTFFVLSTDVGIVNKILFSFGMEQMKFLSDPNYFWGIITAQSIWKETGWGTIIFLAAMAGIDPQRYEAAVMDGAGRFRQIWSITLPGITPTIVIMLILRLGNMADVGFEQIVLMINPLVREVGEVFDTYSYTQGILRGKVSIGVTVGLFKSLVGLFFVITSNYIIKKLGYEGIY
ncbi:ABC transporter permease [Paenibacillus periandrae]|uniref:ABC transporter permease n=1 Tax=Paenibacillus periandrae TaxID=1761741 RepID=UPI001F08B0BC|nr:ABC transporter permease subunit [Paenibacillus periandrae]